MTAGPSVSSVHLVAASCLPSATPILHLPPLHPRLRVDIVAARLRTCAHPGRRPPIMAGITPSPDISPVSAATTNGGFPRDAFCLNLSTLPDANSFVLKSALRSPHLLESPNGLFAGSGALSNPFKKRPRNMSQSSGTDREMSNEHTPPAQANGIAPTSNGTNSEPRPTTKKRPSTDTIDYPRRRATIAVQQPSQCILTFKADGL
jgi:hypothetical protein